MFRMARLVKQSRRFFPDAIKGARSIEKEKGPTLIGPISNLPLLRRLTQALEQSVLLCGRSIYFFFVFFLAMVSSSYVLGPGGETPSHADRCSIADRVSGRNRNLPKNAYFSVA
jgi:hypothetical protein